MAYVYLLAAIVMEVTATAGLKRVDLFARWPPALLVAFGYVGAYSCFSLALRTLPMGPAYAIWSGMGSVLIALVGAVCYGQRLDPPTLIGMSLIVAGTVVLNLFSSPVPH